jgi:malonate transporter and related proteins
MGVSRTSCGRCKFFLSPKLQNLHLFFMLDTLSIVLPIFLLIAFGYGIAALGWLKNSVADALSEFVFIVAIPILLFRTLATAQWPESQPLFYWAAYFGALAIIWVLATVVARRMFGLSGQDVPLAAFTAAQSNTVFVGIPLILNAFGERASVPLFLLLAIHLPITMTAATLLVENKGLGLRQSREMLIKLATHPILIGIFAGLVFRLSGLSMPAPMGTASKLMADAAAPTALFALGMTLRRYGLGEPLRLVAFISALKLMVHPALVYVLAFHVLPVPPIWAAVAVLFAACPCGVNAYLLAQRYDRGVALSSGAIALSTLLAVVTASFWVWMVSGVR